LNTSSHRKVKSSGTSVPELPAGQLSSPLDAFPFNPSVDPFQEAAAFEYHPEWTGRLFRAISVIVRVMCIEPHDELRDAWAALTEAGPDHPQYEHAMEIFSNLEPVNYAAASGRIREAVGSADKLQEARLAKELTQYFRAQYRRAMAQIESDGETN
jgi:iron(III) transport system substrate-binding protein